MSEPHPTTTERPDPAASLSRRGLVATAGAAALIAAVPGSLTPPAGAVTAGAVTAAPRGRPLQVGVLTPVATSHAASGANLVHGLAVGLAAGRRPVAPTLTTRPVTYGYAGAVGGAEELIAGGAQVIVAGVSALAAQRVAPVCRDAGVALVVANVGAHVVTDPEPGVLHSSLQHWQSSLSMGQWAARRLGRRMFTIVSVPDAGYDTVFAVRRGFESAGGAVVGRALTHESPGDDGIGAAVRAARASRAKVVSVSASGRRAAEIVTAIRRAGLKVELVVDSLAVEDFAMGRMGRAAVGAHSVAAWTRTASSAANRSFARAYRARSGRAPDSFAALGHDTGLLIAEGAGRLQTSGRGWSDLAAVLAGSSVPGLRGTQRVHRSLGTVSTPLAVRRTAGGAGRPRQVVVATRQRVDGVPPSLAILGRNEVAAYVNEYLGT
ncbi:ABC transporter substrate-binding protein [Nocardioides pacificus]